MKQGEAVLNQLVLGGIALSVIAGLAWAANATAGLVALSVGVLLTFTGAMGFAVKHGIIAAREHETEDA